LYNTDAEESVIGATLVNREAVAECVARLAPEMFYSPVNREIFGVINDLAIKGIPVDLVTVDQALSERGARDGVGGIEYLVKTTQRIFTTAYVTAHIKIVRELYQMRQLQVFASAVNGMVQGYDGDAAAVVANAQKLLLDISMVDLAGSKTQHIRKPLMEAYKRASERAASSELVSGVPTGIATLDDITDGLQGGQLVIIGARPSMGKTAFALNVLANAAQSGKVCMMFSLEMPSEQIASRMLCGKAGVEMRRFASGKLEPSEWERLSLGLGVMSNAPIWVNDSSALTPSRLASWLRLAVMRHGVQMAVIDYLQIMSGDSRSRSRVEEVTEITRALKSIALELKIPLVVCAQLSRANTARADKRPMLSDLRDSGSIEQDADVVAFLHREAYYDREADPDKAELVVAKNRNGKTGMIELLWEAETMTFYDGGKGIA
jgi:replicative DNA helicase